MYNDQFPILSLISNTEVISTQNTNFYQKIRNTIYTTSSSLQFTKFVYGWIWNVNFDQIYVNYCYNVNTGHQTNFNTLTLFQENRHFLILISFVLLLTLLPSEEEMRGPDSIIIRGFK